MIELLLQADRLLTVDMVDQADAIYRKVAESDPNNAIAVVGMARCALARADDHEAYRLAARALQIDPRNDMARRMEARLAEILTHRGEIPGQASSAAPATAASPPSAATVPPPAAAPPSASPAPSATTPTSASPTLSAAAPPPSATSDPILGTPDPTTVGWRSVIERLRGR